MGRQPSGQRLSLSAQVAAVLAGELPYDDANDDAQAVVRARWDVLLDQDLAALDLEAVFIAEGRQSWVSADAEGRPITVYADRVKGRPNVPGAGPLRGQGRRDH